MKDIWELFRPPSATVLAQRELEDAERQLLQSLTHQDSATAAVAFNTARIKRLRAQLLVPAAKEGKPK